LTPCFETFTFTGVVEIILQVNTPVDCITCNGNDLVVDKASVLYNGIHEDAIDVSLDLKKETISFKFPGVIPSGSAMLSVTFKGWGFILMIRKLE
jgi:hypothetical protein